MIRIFDKTKKMYYNKLTIKYATYQERYERRGSLLVPGNLYENIRCQFPAY